MSESDADTRPGWWARLIAWIERVVAWVMEFKPVKVFIVFGEKRGYLLSAGLAYQAVFAVFASLWVGFSVAGLIVSGNRDLQLALIEVLRQTVPGLIDPEGSGEGIVDPELLLEATIFGWTGAIALIGLFLSALGWMAGARDAIRIMFDLPGPRTNYYLLKLKDAGLALGFGAVLLISAGLSVSGTVAMEGVLEWLGIRDSGSTTVVGRVVTLSVMFVLDTFLLGMLYRVLSGMRIPLRRLIPGALIGAAALGGLKVLGNTLLGGASTNPLLASFAVFVGVLIWFNFVSQVILLTAMWIALGVADDGVVLDPVYEAKRLEAARAYVAAFEPEPEPDEPPWYRRLFGRR